MTKIRRRSFKPQKRKIVKAMLKLLAELAAYDGQIFSRSDRKSQLRMGIAGIAITLVVLSTFFSTLNFFLSVFYGSKILSLLIASVISMLILTLLLLLNLTVSNDIQNNHQKKQKYISTIIRIFFISTIAMFVAEPIKIKVFKNKIEPHIIVTRHNKKADIDRLISTISTSDNQKIDTAMIKIIYENITNNTYITEQIKYQYLKIPESIIINILFIILFLMPIMIRILDHPIRQYKNTQHQISTMIVKNHYNMYCEIYKQIFSKKFNLDHDVKTIYNDPPFNTQRKVKSPPPDQKEFGQFIDTIY